MLIILINKAIMLASKLTRAIKKTSNHVINLKSKDLIVELGTEVINSDSTELAQMLNKLVKHIYTTNRS